MVYHPEEYGDGHFLDIESLDLKVDLGSLFERELVIERVEMDINSAMIAYAKDGKENAANFFGAMIGKGGEAYRIDSAEISLKTLAVLDLSEKPPRKRIYQVGVRKKFENSRNWRFILDGVTPVTAKVRMK